MRKLWLTLIMAVMMIPLWIGTAMAAEVTGVNWVTRNDAPIPFVRLVVSLSEPVGATASIDKAGTTTTVTLKGTKLNGAADTVYMDRTIATKANFSQKGNDVAVAINTPSAVDVSDVKVFSVKKDTVNNKPYRMVIDISKKGVAPRTDYYGSAARTAEMTAAAASAAKLTSQSKAAKATKTSTSTGTYKKVDLKAAMNKSTQPAAAPATPVTNVAYRTSGGLAGKIITLDPGHGGSDSGAVGADGYMEKQITLPIALKLKQVLESKGATVYMTRTDDHDVYGPFASGPDELQARSDVANNHRADVFISIHINAFNNPSVGGIATYYYDKTDYDSKLATAIQNQIAYEKGFGGDRGIQPGNLYVLRHTLMPAVLVELGFISNPTEENLLKTDATQQDFANEIAAGLETYFRG